MGGRRASSNTVVDRRDQDRRYRVLVRVVPDGTVTDRHVAWTCGDERAVLRALRRIGGPVGTVLVAVWAACTKGGKPRRGCTEVRSGGDMDDWAGLGDRVLPPVQQVRVLELIAEVYGAGQS